jgi:integrase
MIPAPDGLWRKYSGLLVVRGIPECLGLRMGCLNLGASVLTVHGGKGQNDRTVPLPQILLPEIRELLRELPALHRADLDIFFLQGARGERGEKARLDCTPSA